MDRIRGKELWKDVPIDSCFSHYWPLNGPSWWSFPYKRGPDTEKMSRWNVLWEWGKVLEQGGFICLLMPMRAEFYDFWSFFKVLHHRERASTCLYFVVIQPFRWFVKLKCSSCSSCSSFFLMIQKSNLSFLLLYNYLYINYIYNNKGRKLSFLICL